MTLDEMEKRIQWTLTDEFLPQGHRERVLAEFLRLVLPVVRAAMTQVDVSCDCLLGGHTDECAEAIELVALMDAVDTMRAAMEGK